MKMRLVTVIGICGLVISVLVSMTVEAQVNTWTNSTSGSTFKWEDGINWSLGVPPNSNQSDSFITNAASPSPNRFRIVNIDSVTVSANGSNGCLTVSNLTVSAPGGTFPSFNTLVLNNAGSVTPLTILNSCTISANGSLLLTNSTVVVGHALALNGNVSLQPGGTLLVTNYAFAVIGFSGVGNVTLGSNSLWRAIGPQIGTFGTGTLTINGGMFETVGAGLDLGVQVAHTIDSTGTVWISGGTLLATNSASTIGSGNGNLILSNGTVSMSGIYVGRIQGPGNLIVAGGILRSTGFLDVGVQGGTGDVFVTGGELDVTNSDTAYAIGTIFLGENGLGRMTISNGTVVARNLVIATNGVACGELNLIGGTLIVLSQTNGMIVGQTPQGTGVVTVAGGQIVATNGLGLIALGNDGTTTNGTGMGTMSITNGTVIVNTLLLGSNTGGQGSVTVHEFAEMHVVKHVDVSSAKIFVNGGTINGSNATLSVGANASSEFIVSNGVATFLSACVGSNTTGALTMLGGTVTVLSNLLVGATPQGTGVVMVTGGNIVATNGPGIIGIGNNGTTSGSGGVGQMIISNATVLAHVVLLGNTSGGSGSLILRPGGHLAQPAEACPPNALCRLSSNDVLLDGGAIDFANAALYVGEGHPANVTISNGLAVFQQALVGFDNTGTVTMPGGTMTVLSNMVVGDCGMSVTGVVTVAGGSLYVTNATHTAVLDLRNGTFTLNSGTMVVDTLIMTNSCARFVHTGGTLIYGSLVLDPNLSAVGDGIPNGWKQQYGLDPFDPNLGTEDPDGDGCNNLCEFLTGGNPVADIKSITRQGSDIALTWQAAANRTNALQAASGANGSYSNNFADIFTVTNNTGGVTNYLDAGGATNKPTRYYRVRLVP